MFSYIFGNSINALRREPVRIYAFTLLQAFMTGMARIACGLIPLASTIISQTIDAGMRNLFLSVYKGEEITTKKMLVGFNNTKHVAGGMMWRLMWLSIWSAIGVACLIIPVLGIIVCIAMLCVKIYKSYGYCFMPYILVNEPDLPVTDALNKSKSMTNGYKGSMFLADLILNIIPYVYFFIVLLVLIASTGIFSVRSRGLYGGLYAAQRLSAFSGLYVFLIVIFLIIGVILLIASKMLSGIVNAGYYYEVTQNPGGFNSMDRFGGSNNYGSMGRNNYSRQNAPYTPSNSRKYESRRDGQYGHEPIGDHYQARDAQPRRISVNEPPRESIPAGAYRAPSRGERHYDERRQAERAQAERAQAEKVQAERRQAERAQADRSGGHMYGEKKTQDTNSQSRYRSDKNDRIY